MMGRAAIAVLLTLVTAQPAFARDVTVLVDARAGPWSVAANPKMKYGVGDALPPMIVTGFPSDIDGQIEIVPQGTTMAAQGGAVDGNGVASEAVDDIRGPRNKYYPSFYTPKVLYPANRHALLGVFVDAAGRLLSRPFVIGTGMRVGIPAGAHGLALGFNDVVATGNSGALSVQVRMPDE